MRHRGQLFLLSILVVAVAGCSTGVMHLGANRYQVSTTGSSGFVSSAGAQKRALEEARAHCGSLGKVMVVDDMSSEEGRAGRKYPKADLKFRCLAKDDPEAQQGA